MNKLTIAVLSTLALAGCGKPADTTMADLTTGMNQYLAAQGNLCLAKTSWPIDVTQNEIDAHARNALQMPVLEKLGLVSSGTAVVDVKDEDRSATIKVLRYQLTDEGKKYYLTKDMHRMAPDGSTQILKGDFCAAKLTLDKVVKWDEIKSNDGQKKAVVTYTYKVDAAPWTRDAAVQQVFPMVARIVNGAGTEQLQETLKMTPQGWVASEM